MAKTEDTKQYTEGRLYMRDTRNGRIHEYQPLLAEMGYMQRFIYGQETGASQAPQLKTQLVGAERAAEYDRRAALSQDERDAEDVEAEKAEQEQTRADALVPTEPTKPKYNMTAKAEKAKYEDFIAQGWKDQQLLDAGYMTEAK